MSSGGELAGHPAAGAVRANSTSARTPMIRVSAVLAVDGAGRLLVVRKRGTQVWMQPGGKPEPGETPAETLARELHEELGVRLDASELEPLGTFTTAAANEAGTTLIADVFRATIEHPVVADAEIDAVSWMHPRDFAHHQLAPLITEHMLALMPRPGRGAAAGTSTDTTQPLLP
ncbi:MAG: NUDIX domain-containing protein [Microcella sp.]|nr:NUDIX domain-containing protein [Microcella sp.]